MKIWLTTDTHFNHEKLKTMGKGRPDDYEQRLWKSLKAIPQTDTLIHLGDICIGDDEAVHKKLFEEVWCRKVLVKGNHDNKSDNWYYEHGWDFVCHETVIKAFGKLILLKHIPLGVEHKGELNLHIHGHLHGTGDESHRAGEVFVEGGIHDPRWHYDVAPDTHNYQAVTLESIIKKTL